MQVSGFSFARNTSKLYYPIRESIMSVLPIVDEFVIALGDSDPDDNTLALIESIGSPKIRIVHTHWDTTTYAEGGVIYAQQTDVAKAACKGDWLLYLQSDEVVHEKYLDTIVASMERHLGDPEVEGLLFDFVHFYGDYNHYNDFHGWYDEEIRVIRNDPEIHSFKDAQSFRRIRDFDGISYTRKEGTMKLRVKKIDAAIYHYGWVRPPSYMKKKTIAFDRVQLGEEKNRAKMQQNPGDLFDYGNLYRLRTFEDSHPAVMKGKIAQFDWSDQLHYEKGYKSNNIPPMKHERLKYRLLTRVERMFFGGRHIFDYSNWHKV